MKFNKIPILIFFTLLVFIQEGNSQELNCRVRVSSQKINGSEKSTFTALQQSVQEFMNTRKWTSDKYSQTEKIECSILINVTQRLSNSSFKGTIQIQSRRPVFGSSYNSTMFNYLDNNFNFNYVKFETIQYSETESLDNLTSVLAYYAYVILALDYDSFSLYGGTPYFQIARNIVNNAQTANEPGWKAFESQKNRYWLIDNYMNPQFKPMRECSYKYHRLGFDIMANKIVEGRNAVTEGLQLLEKVYRRKPNSFNMQLFFNAKFAEVVSLYSSATQGEKNRIVPLLSRIDPSRVSKYQVILKAKK